jgi:hypothetical protein
MTRSFALMLAAVTLRIFAMPLESVFGQDTGYYIVAWACWVPNIIVAELVIRARRRKDTVLQDVAAVSLIPV